MFICQQIQEESSNAIGQENEAGSDDNLLKPFRSSDIEQSPSSQESTNEDDLDCTQCNQSFRSVAGLQKHLMVKHNLHSFRSVRKVSVWNHFNASFVANSALYLKVQKRKRPKSSSLESNHRTIKKEKMVNI